MFEDFWEGVKEVAPALATAVSGPAAGVAVKVLSKAIFGDDTHTKEDLDSVIYSDEIKAKLVIAEYEFQKTIAILAYESEKLRQLDSDSARKMQTETHSKMPSILSLILISSFIFVIYYVLEHGVKESNEIILILLGALSTSVAQVIQFYFGSSLGSMQKNNIFDNLKK